jgi:hypothetical protein
MSDDKIQITKIIYDLLKEKGCLDIPFDKVLFRWWQTGKSKGSFRLKPEGNLAFQQAEIASYNFTFVHDKNHNIVKTIWMMGKLIKCPFFIDKSDDPKSKHTYNITIYNGKIASLIILYGGITEFLKAQHENSNYTNR